MKRAEIMAVARTQETDASCIGPKRGMSHRGKRLGAQKVRQHLKQTDRREAMGDMKIIGAMLSLVSYALTFWAGGCFTLAVTTIDRNGGVTPDELMRVLSWPVSCFHWLLR